MTMRSTTIYPDFSVKLFFLPIYTNYAYFDTKKITLKSSAQKYELKLSLVGPLSTLCLTHPTLLPRGLIKNITLKSSAQKPLS
jgi:hypothetical protein